MSGFSMEIPEINRNGTGNVLSAKCESDVVFCLLSYRTYNQ